MEERNKDLQLLSYSNAERGENDRKWVTMRNVELAAETRLRLNIRLPEQRPNPFRDKCRVSEAHLLCGLRFNNWHYNSISHHYLAEWWCCRDGVSEGKEQREWEEDGERTVNAEGTVRIHSCVQAANSHAWLVLYCRYTTVNVLSVRLIVWFHAGAQLCTCNVSTVTICCHISPWRTECGHKCSQQSFSVVSDMEIHQHSWMIHKALLFSPTRQRIFQGGWGRCFDRFKGAGGEGLSASHCVAHKLSGVTEVYNKTPWGKEYRGGKKQAALKKDKNNKIWLHSRPY